MKYTYLLTCIALGLLGCSATSQDPNTLGSVSSPDGALSLRFFLDDNAHLSYEASFENEIILAPSRLGFSFKNQPDWGQNLQLEGHEQSAGNETYHLPFGEVSTVSDHYQEMTLVLKEKEAPHRQVALQVRVFHDGFGFRYNFAPQQGVDEITITEERSSFTLTGDHTAWWIPADYDTYEYLYNETPVSEIDQRNAKLFDLNSTSLGERHAVNTPVTMKTAEGVYLSFHEANLTNYSGMTLKVGQDKRTLTSFLTPAADGTKATVALPFHTPWRTVQVATSPAGLLESHLITNLAEDQALDDISWMNPGKYMGIWWGHHLGKTTWAPGPKGGATTEEAKRYIDFASQHGFPSLLIEGWNRGWDKWGQWPLPPNAFSFTEDAPGFNLREVVAYANEKKVAIIAHHETTSVVTEYEEQMEAAFDLLQELGIHAVKTGYVGPIVPKGEHHHGQWMVNHYRRVVELAAEHEVMIIAHEPIKPTGLRRTYPHMVAREGVRGSEFNSPWGGGNPPEHLTIVPFTRMLAGPIDYTPGIVNLDLSPYTDRGNVPTTVGYQLAEYMVISSPVQMASDLPENYEGQLALDFIKAVPTNWEQTRVLNAEIGDYITVVRQERGTQDWYLGSLTNAEARTLYVSLDFLPEGTKYTAHIYADNPDAHYLTNSMDYGYTEKAVSSEDTLTLPLVPGGGVAIHFEAR